jgi:hypothetical protein
VGKFTEIKDHQTTTLKKRDYEEGEIDENKGKEYLSLNSASSQPAPIKRTLFA